MLTHEKKEHSDHAAEITALKASWTHARPRVSASKLSPTSRRIHFVRHGQGTHNLLAKEIGFTAYKDERVADARLTELGREQASKNQPSTAELPLNIVYVSPLSRAVETALLAFKGAQEKGVLFQAAENLREQIGCHCCDRRRSVDEIQADFPSVSFKELETNADVLWTEEREPKSGVAERGFAFFEMLRETDFSEVAVVGHSSHLLTMFNVVLDCGEEEELQGWFETGELRSLWVDL